MTPDLAARIRALPEHVHGELSVVPGPGWYLRGRFVEGSPYASELLVTVPPLLLPGDAWWPANPAQSVEVVTGWPLSACYAIIGVRLQSGESDDHAAALSIIEDHIARSTA